MPTENSFRNCDFSNATLLQKAGPNSTGYTVNMNMSTTKMYYFSCSKLCASHSHKVQVCVANKDRDNTTECSSAVTTSTKIECTAARTYDLQTMMTNNNRQ